MKVCSLRCTNLLQGDFLGKLVSVSHMMVAEVLMVVAWWIRGFSGGDTTERPLGAGGPHSYGLRQHAHRASPTTPWGLTSWSSTLKVKGPGLPDLQSPQSGQIQSQVHDMNWSRYLGSLQPFLVLPSWHIYLSSSLVPVSVNVLSGGSTDGHQGDEFPGAVQL